MIQCKKQVCDMLYFLYGFILWFFLFGFFVCLSNYFKSFPVITNLMQNDRLLKKTWEEQLKMKMRFFPTWKGFFFNFILFWILHQSVSWETLHFYK